jgi:hypothetical protein
MHAISIYLFYLTIHSIFLTVISNFFLFSFQDAEAAVWALACWRCEGRSPTDNSTEPRTRASFADSFSPWWHEASPASHGGSGLPAPCKARPARGQDDDGAGAAVARALGGSWCRETLRSLIFVAEFHVDPCGFLSHPILQGKPNASHMCARIIYTHDRQNESNTIAVIKRTRV